MMIRQFKLGHYPNWDNGTNYVSLLPGESRTIRNEAASGDLGGARPLVVVDGWNVTAKARGAGRKT